MNFLRILLLLTLVHETLAFSPRSWKTSKTSTVSNRIHVVEWVQRRSAFKASAVQGDFETGSSRSTGNESIKKPGLIRRIITFGTAKIRKIPSVLQSLKNRVKRRQSEGSSVSTIEPRIQHTTDGNNNTPNDGILDTPVSLIVEETKAEEKFTLEKIKEAGTAGVISYALWELGFWIVSAPVVLFGYYKFSGHWPDLSSKEDIATLSAEAFAFVNFARLAVPLRIGLALSTTPWIQNNIVDKYMNENKGGKD